MTRNSESKKPEWFELTDDDAPSARVTKVSKKLPTIAVLVTGAIIATGAFIASASESDSDEGQIASTSFNQVDSQGASATGTTSEVTNSNPAAPVTTSIQDPAQGGMKAPGRNVEVGDDEDGHDEGREHEGRERGDHKERENDKNA
jgi:hypothetical protein